MLENHSTLAQNHVNGFVATYLIIEFYQTRNLVPLVKFLFELEDDSPLTAPLVLFILDHKGA